MINPDIKFIKSKGIDLPILNVYLAGRIAGNVIDKCIGWRREIIEAYRNYKGKGAYPIAFIDPLNSGEADTIDEKGLQSNIPANLIYDKDLLSVQSADVIVANMEDFFEEGIEDILKVKSWRELPTNGTLDSTRDKLPNGEEIDFKEAFYILKSKIINRRENIGTTMEVAWALLLNKPVILIVPEKRKEMFEKHPFTKRASVIVTSVDQLLEEKWLNTLYKSIAGATC